MPDKYIEKIKRNIPPHLNKLLADVITVFLSRINVPGDEIEKVTKHIYERRIQEMFTFIDNYDVQETRREAAKENSIAIARKLLIRNRPIDEIAEVTGLSKEEVESLRDTN